MKLELMFILQLLLIVFLVVITLLLVALIIVRRIMYRINRRVHKIFSSEQRQYDERENTINDLYRKEKRIQQNQGEYVDFEEIKP